MKSRVIAVRWFMVGRLRELAAVGCSEVGECGELDRKEPRAKIAAYITIAPSSAFHFHSKLTFTPSMS